MPEQTEGLMRGFQLWLNLTKDKKMITPSYKDIHAEEIPVIDSDGIKVKVISGEYQSVIGPGRPYTGVLYIDVQLEEGSSIDIPVEDDWNAFIYVYEGEISADTSISKGKLAVLDTQGQFGCKATMNPTKFILVAGKPLNEPVARGGPFVMNTKEEILQAFEDYQSGKMG